MKKYPNKKYMSHDEIVKMQLSINKIYSDNCDLQVWEINEKLCDALFGGNYDAYCDTVDGYKDLRETVTTLNYHHKLYKQGTTRKDMFLRVCGSMYFDGKCE